MSASLLIELGCEEIPARMIANATREFERRLCEILDQAGLAYQLDRSWGGTRRMAVRLDNVQETQADRDERVLGPPAKIAFGKDGAPTPAGIGFAKKQGIKPAELQRIATDKGDYVGFERHVAGRDIEEILAGELPAAVAGIPFPKSMRWAEGEHRWVRPLHWVVALFGDRVLNLSLFDVTAGRNSMGHRFRSEGAVRVGSPASYEADLAAAGVVIDPEARKSQIRSAMEAAASAEGGRLVSDDALLQELSYLVETPGVVVGHFGEGYLELPREILVTTLRHHQKCFSVQSAQAKLIPVFMAIANTDTDPAGHIRRGNEWVVGGRLEDARFFWREDRKESLDALLPRLDAMVVHAKIGNYREKSERLAALANQIAQHLGFSAEQCASADRAGRLAKVDLVTGTVGEFPELQGKVGGLLLKADGEPADVSQAIYEHYQPEGPSDQVPTSPLGAVVSLADKLDSTRQFIEHVETPTGSRDPFGLRRATNGIFRVIVEGGLDVGFDAIARWVDHHEPTLEYLRDRLRHFLRESGYQAGEIQAVLASAQDEGSIGELRQRLAALGTVREREDFGHLVDLTKRVDNILTKNAKDVKALRARVTTHSGSDSAPAAVELGQFIENQAGSLEQAASAKDFGKVIEGLASFIRPVDRFFEEVLVINKDNDEETLARVELLERLRSVLTADFDIRELAGDAGRKG